jgi:alcohol dehydrogenase
MLNDYVQYNSEKILFGKGVESQVGIEVAKYGKKVLVHYDTGDFIIPLIDKISENLKAAGNEVFRLGGVEPNPKVSLGKKGMRIVRENDIDFILAVGGGSTMDSVKYIACGTYYEGNILEHPNFQPITSRVLPHGAVVTLPGTGSEVSTAAVLRDDTTDPERKYCIFAEEFRFDFAIINPEITYTLPPLQTAAGAFDIISHAMEDYFVAPSDVEFMLAAIEGIINEVMKNVKVVLKDPYNYTARSNLSRVAYLTLEDIITKGMTHGFCVHNLEKPMTSIYHKIHGEMLAIFTPAWMKYCYQENISRFTRLCVNCFGAKMDYENSENTVIEGINNLENFIHEIGLSTTLAEVGIKDDLFEFCADMAVNGDRENGYIGEATKLNFNDIIKVYELAK